MAGWNYVSDYRDLLRWKYIAIFLGVSWKFKMLSVMPYVNYDLSNSTECAMQLPFWSLANGEFTLFCTDRTLKKLSIRLWSFFQYDYAYDADSIFSLLLSGIHAQRPDGDEDVHPQAGHEAAPPQRHRPAAHAPPPHAAHGAGRPTGYSPHPACGGTPGREQQWRRKGVKNVKMFLSSFNSRQKKL